MSEPAALSLCGIVTRARHGPVLRDVSLAVAAGQVVTLLGAPGSGKSLLLRVAAGLVRPRGGRVLLHRAEVTRVPPRRRGIALVEQTMGLFPRMSVAETLGFVDPGGRRVPGLLLGAELSACADRLPGALRPGERARLAVARALAAAPRALLLDGIADGLDRDATARLFALLRSAAADGLAILYATGEAEHAMALGDRMTVLARGTIAQEGPPQSVYDRPAELAVARLTGPLNMLAGSVMAVEDDEIRVRLDAGAEVAAIAGEGATDAFGAGTRCVVCVRPERLAVSTLPPQQLGERALAARVIAVRQCGAQGRLDLLVGDASVTAIRPAGGMPPSIVAGRTIAIAWQPHHAVAWHTNAAPL